MKVEDEKDSLLYAQGINPSFPSKLNTGYHVAKKQK